MIFDLISFFRTEPTYRRILATTDRSQLVLMSIPPEHEIGSEVHMGDQFIYIVGGKGYAILNGITYEIYPGVGFIIPAGTQHNIIAGGDELHLITVYTPPEH